MQKSESDLNREQEERITAFLNSDIVKNAKRYLFDALSQAANIDELFRKHHKWGSRTAIGKHLNAYNILEREIDTLLISAREDLLAQMIDRVKKHHAR